MGSTSNKASSQLQLRCFHLTLLKSVHEILGHPQPEYQKRCFLKRAFSGVLCANFGLGGVKGTLSTCG